MNDNWYVRSTAGKTFGPISFDVLRQWVRDGRVEPLAGISQDLENWMLAPLRPELEMNWIVENNPGQFYGPTHRAVLDDLVAGGSLSPGARFYQDDGGAAAAAAAALEARNRELAAAADHAKEELAALRAELSAAQTALDGEKSETGRLRAETDALRKTLAAKDEALAAKDEALKAQEKTLALREAELARREEVHEREWRTEVLVPEVVVSDEPPPPVARTVFGAPAQPASGAQRQPANTLADLERRAQEELARMGGMKAGRFFFKGK